MRISAMLSIIIATLAYADSATQSDWSEGPGIWGPVTDWGNEFYDCSGIDYGTDVKLQTNVQHLVEDEYYGPYSVHSADINDDGHMDIVGCSLGEDNISWWENNDGSGTSWTKHLVDEFFEIPYSVYTDDMDGDGRIDVMAAGWDTLAWLRNENGTGNEWIKIIIDSGFEFYFVRSADIDGDGDKDVISSSYHGFDVCWWENDDGAGTAWIRHTIDSGSDSPTWVYPADIDGDGHIDIMDAGTVDMSWWENVDGSGTTWTEHSICDDFLYGHCICPGDFDGDGDMDAVGSPVGGPGGPLTWWENEDGLGTSWSDHFISSGNNIYSLCTADMDRDGDYDIVTAKNGYTSGDLSWFENMDGHGTAWQKRYVALGIGGVRGACPSDIDEDGHTDLIGAIYESDFIAWWDVFQMEGFLESSVLDALCSPEWQTLEWTSTEPEPSSVVFQVRASNNPDSMGAWSDTLVSPGSLAGIISNGDSLFQYKAILRSSRPDDIPELHDVTITWNPGTGIESEAERGFYALYGARPNPAHGSAVLVLSLPVDALVELSVYDLTGRVVQSIKDDYAVGMHQVRLDDLPSGLYLARMTSGCFTESKPIVILE